MKRKGVEAPVAAGLLQGNAALLDAINQHCLQNYTVGWGDAADADETQRRTVKKEETTALKMESVEEVTSEQPCKPSYVERLKAFATSFQKLYLQKAGKSISRLLHSSSFHNCVESPRHGELVRATLRFIAKVADWYKDDLLQSAEQWCVERLILWIRLSLLTLEQACIYLWQE